MRVRRSVPRAALAVVVTAILAGACSTSAEQPVANPFDARRGDTEDVLLTVENNDFRDATIYVYWNGMRTRAGTVTGKTSETFRMEWKGEWVQLGVDFLGRGGYTTERVDVLRGDHLNFVIMGMP